MSDSIGGLESPVRKVAVDNLKARGRPLDVLKEPSSGPTIPPEPPVRTFERDLRLQSRPDGIPKGHVSPAVRRMNDRAVVHRCQIGAVAPSCAQMFLFVNPILRPIGRSPRARRSAQSAAPIR